MISAQAILHRIDRLPAFSGAVARVNALLDDDNAAARDFEKAIQVDPALAANLLELANSAYFGCRAEVCSVAQAVMLVGTTRIRDLVLSAAFSHVLPDRLPGYGVTAEAFWRHCVAVAVIGESLAKSLVRTPPDIDPRTVFTAGLLHDIGKLAVCEFLEQNAEQVFARMDGAGTAFAAAECEVLGIGHAEAGALVATAWGLPEDFAVVARYHHCPDQAPPALQGVVDAVHAGDALSYLLGYGVDRGGLAREVSPGVAQRLDINVRNIEAIACETQERVAELGASLQRH